MKFWKRLRTIFSLLFVVLLLLGWLGIEPSASRSPTGTPTRAPADLSPLNLGSHDHDDEPIALHLSRRARLALMLLVASPAFAAEATPQACELRVASGPTGKVYEQIVRDMRTACGSDSERCAR